MNTVERIRAYRHIICPLTGKIMVHPVVIADGYSYEREAIEAWLTTNDQSPITGEIIQVRYMIPNLALMRYIARVGGPVVSSSPLPSSFPAPICLTRQTNAPIFPLM